MKIDSSNILLSSQHTLVEQQTRQESLRMWAGDRRPITLPELPPAPPRMRLDSVSISQEAKTAQKTDPAGDAQEAIENDPRMQLVISMVEALTGKKIKILSLKDLQSVNAPSAEAIRDPGQQPPSPPPRAGFGIEYDLHETRYEAEQTSFSAQGVVKTSDGREIVFDLQLSMSREHLEQTDVSIRLGDAVRQTKDPLVLNFNGNAAQLSSTKFSFDLDSDGQAENISFVAPGSGFLVFDKNQDGLANNGSELFGAVSGDGFAELAAHDLDGNRWIDENDAVFSQLKLWTRDGAGQDQLATLSEAGIGALYLGKVATEFSLKNADQQLDGQVRASGVYLNENGTAGTLQQIDLAV
ncbi:MAG: hypothetical protein Q8O37_14900 [Sulfuricellaceae bacterium]|nr:hypothetical protein [Sulfuricellaceae bacterium]